MNLEIKKGDQKHDHSMNLDALRQEEVHHHIDTFFDDQSETSHIKLKESHDYGYKIHV
jgi:hypothetical protein